MLFLPAVFPVATSADTGAATFSDITFLMASDLGCTLLIHLLLNSHRWTLTSHRAEAVGRVVVMFWQQLRK